MTNQNAKPNPMKTILHTVGLLATLTLGGNAALAAPTIPNPSFEANSFTVFPGYHHQAGNGAITGWTASGGAGLNPAQSSPFADNGVIPNGSQVAFIQNGADSFLSTVISDLAVGTTYKVNFRVNARSGNTPNLKVEIDGVNILNTAVTPVGGANPYKYFAFDFTASAPAQTLTLRNDAAPDNTVVLDDFSIETHTSGWSYAAWNDDASSGVDSTKTYTHAYSFGSAVGTTINGIPFTGIGVGNPAVPASFSTAGLPAVFNNDPNNVIEGSRQLANDFLYNGAVQSVTIDGLIFGKSYVATLYSVGWENGTRAATFSVGNDRLTVNQDHFGDNNGIRVSYRYTATASSITLTFVPLQGNTFHTYGFSNYEVPPPQVANPSFEVDAVPPFPGYGPITGWTVNGGGINSAAGPFHDNGTIPDGAKIAFIQSDGAMTQVIDGFIVGGTYQLRYFENARNCCSGTAPFAEVKIGGTTIVAAHAVPPVGGGNPYREVLSDTFVAASTSLELAIIKSNPQTGDTTLLIDNVSIVPPNTAPTITLQPNDATIGLGDSATFTVGAAGSAPLTYQWYFGTDGLDATTPTLTVVAQFPDVAGDYFVVVANSAGSITSRVARLTVRDKITAIFNTGVDDTGVALPDGAIDPHYALIQNPDSTSPDTFVENSSGFPIVAGPWVANNAGSKWIGPRFDTTAAAGAAGEGGDYTYRTVVDVTGFEPAGVVITGVWATDNAGLDILVNGQSTGQGNVIQFGGLTPFSITNCLAGPNTIDFKLNNAAVGYTGLRVDQIRALGTALPPGTPPTIVQQPVNFTATIGERATFTSRANGSGPIGYQWYFGPDPLFDQTNATLSFLFEFPEQAGPYRLEVVNDFGVAHSSFATLIYREAPLIVTQPQSQAVASGEPVTFTATANGAEPLAYQWQKDGSDIPGANSPSYAIAAAAPGDAGTYNVRVSNFAGSVTSADATLSVLELISGLFNTGVDASGVSLPSGTVDPHWTITQSVDPSFPGPDAFVLNDGGFPIPPWLENDGQSKWIAPQANQGGGNLEGDYNYRTTFSLDGFDPATVRVTGEWATDNTGLDILVNGVSTGQGNTGGFVVWTPFQLNTGFAAGQNTLDFKVNNAAPGVNPTGFRVRNLRALGVPLPPNQPPIARNDTVTTLEGTPVAFNVLANDSDPDGDSLTVLFAFLPTPIHGQLALSAAGEATYTPDTGFIGTASFHYTISDGHPGGTNFATVTITVAPRNQAPTARIVATPLVNFGPTFEHEVLISDNGSNACLVLDGTSSSDPDNDPLTYLWFVVPDPLPFSTAAVTASCLDLGEHTIRLVVQDGKGGSGDAGLTIEVISAGEAVDLLVGLVNDANLDRKNKRPFIATLKAATASFDRGNHTSGLNQLHAFQNKVLAQLGETDPATAAEWIRLAQAIADAVGGE